MARWTLLALPYEIVIEIAGIIAMTSPHPMEDLYSLRGTYVSTVHAHGVHGARREEPHSARAGEIHEVVIDVYIKLLKAQEGLKKRPGETASLVAIMKRDGKKDEPIEANYPNRGTSQRPGLVQRVLAYLKHDMVAIFLNDLLIFHYQFFLCLAKCLLFNLIGVPSNKC